MATLRQDLGPVTAYAYAVSEGYTGTEEEFAEVLANFADSAGQVAADAAQVALDKGAVHDDKEAVDSAEGRVTSAVNTFTTTTAPNAVTAVENAGAAQIGLVEAEGTRQIGLVADKGAEQVGTVSSEGTTQIGLVEAKGAEVIASIPGDYSTLQGDIASTYSSSSTYAVGDYVLYSGQLYRCTTAISTAESWTSGHWSAVKLTDDVGELKSALDAKINIGLSGIRTLVDHTGEFVKNYYIPNGSVGTIINPSDVQSWNTTSNKAAYCLFPVSAGDIVRFQGSNASGSTSRAMVLTDSEYKVVKASPSGASTNAIIEWTVEVNGYCLIDALYLQSSNARDYTAYQMKNDTYAALQSDIVSWNEYKNDGYIQIPGNWSQGEFGSFAGVTYASKSPWMELARDTLFMVTDPKNYYLTFYINNNGTLSKNTSNPTWGVFKSGTRIRVAVNAKDETVSVTPAMAKTKALMNIPISANERMKSTYSAVGVFDQIGIIGDSFAVGSMHWENDGYKGYPNLSWGKLMCKRNGNNCTLYAHGGYGIKRFVEYILPTVLTDDPCNLYWWGLGINDNETARTNASATGTIADITNHEIDGEYPDTLYGNFGRAVSQIKTHAPLAKHVFASCIKDNVNNRYTSYTAINTVLKTVADHYGFPFIEITDDPFYWSAFYRDSAWVGHPVLIGYAGMSWANERLLNKCIVDNMSYFRDFGRTNNPEDTDPTGQE